MRFAFPMCASFVVFFGAFWPTADGQQIPSCRAHQLTVHVHGLSGGRGHEATVFGVQNKSHSVCTVGGVPTLAFLEGAARRVPLSVCANCDDYFFHSKSAEPLRLQPGDSAHFVLGYVGALPNRASCRVVEEAQVFFGNDPVGFMVFQKDANPSVSGQTYGADSLSICSPNVSAWQPGLTD
jgi:Protein of unknown function (DUF4232)